MALGPAGTLPRRARGRGRGRERGREGGRGRSGGDVCGSRSVEVRKEKNREGNCVEVEAKARYIFGLVDSDEKPEKLKERKEEAGESHEKR